MSRPLSPLARIWMPLLVGCCLCLGWTVPLGALPEAASRPLGDLRPGPEGSILDAVELSQGQVGGRTLLAVSRDGVTAQLWATSGTAASTGPILERPLSPFDPLGLAVLATTGSGALARVEGGELWWADPEGAPSRFLGAMAPSGGGFAWPLASALGDGSLLFRGRDGAGEELWRTDGTPGGTRRVADLVPGGGSAFPGGFVTWGGGVGFQAKGAGAIRFDTLWTSDGTQAGTRKILRVEDASLFPLAGTAHRVLFRVLGADPSREGIWATNGQAGNATRLIPAAIDAPVHTAPLPGRGLLVAIQDPAGGVRLWFTDGTAAGTEILEELGTGEEAVVQLRAPASEAGLSGPRILMVWEDDLGWRFWASDGTEPGTTPFTLPLGDEHDEANPPVFLASDDEALFWAFSDGLTGGEPWLTDREGLDARLIGDLCSGSCSSDPFAPRVLAAGGATFAASPEGEVGLWFASREEPGALPLLAPGSLEGPQSRTSFGYVGARTTSTAGREPWAVTIASPCESDATTHCLNGGRFVVRALWRTSSDAGVGQVFPLTDDTGAFWFFRPENLELVVKVLDGCALYGRYWVYASGLTTVEVELTVSDTVTGRTNPYFNPLGTPFVFIGDTGAFPCE